MQRSNGDSATLPQRCIELFQLVPTSPPHLWLIAADWLEEEGAEVIATVFREQLWSPQPIDGDGYGEGHGEGGDSNGVGYGDDIAGSTCGGLGGGDICGNGNGLGDGNGYGYGDGCGDGDGVGNGCGVVH